MYNKPTHIASTIFWQRLKLRNPVSKMHKYDMVSIDQDYYNFTPALIRRSGFRRQVVYGA